MPTCNSCHREFDDFRTLALHIAHEKRGHQRGKKWAAKYLLKPIQRELPKRTPLTEEEKELLEESKQDCKRELSGITKVVQAFCLKCKRFYPRVVEIEYIQSDYALRRGNTLLITCDSCEGRVERHAPIYRQTQTKDG